MPKPLELSAINLLISSTAFSLPPAGRRISSKRFCESCKESLPMATITSPVSLMTKLQPSPSKQSTCKTELNLSELYIRPNTPVSFSVLSSYIGLDIMVTFSCPSDRASLRTPVIVYLPSSPLWKNSRKDKSTTFSSSPSVSSPACFNLNMA